MVTLENRLRQMLVFNLAHEAWCGKGTCACKEMTVVVTDENPRTGERAPRRVPRKVPASLTLLAREVRSGLPDAVMEVPDVRVAMARGHVRVVRQEPDTASPLPLEPMLDAALEDVATASRSTGRAGRKG